MEPYILDYYRDYPLNVDVIEKMNEEHQHLMIENEKLKDKLISYEMEYMGKTFKSQNLDRTYADTRMDIGSKIATTDKFAGTGQHYLSMQTHNFGRDGSNERIPSKKTLISPHKVNQQYLT